MADFDSSLPVRTQTNGDVVAQLVDATVLTQKLAINASGQALVLDGSDGPVSPGTAASFAGLVAGQYNSSLPTLTSTQQAALQVDSSGRLIISPLTSASSVTALQGTSPWVTSDLADGSSTGGAAGSKSALAGGIFNTVLPSLTSGQQVGLQVDSSGRLLTVSNVVFSNDTNYGVVGSNTIRTAAQIGNATGAADFNAGVSGAQTLRVSANIMNNGTALDYNFGAASANSVRVASLIGNSTGAADFNAGATGAQTLRVVANQGAANATPWNENIAQIAGASPSASNSLPVQISTGGSFVSTSNPLPVTIDVAAGTTVMDYKDAVAIAGGSSDNHDYTVTAGKTLHLRQIESSASGKAKMVLAIETGVATGVFTTRAAQFNSTATPDMSLQLQSDLLVAAGVRVRVTMSNRDVQAEDLYSSIIGFEV